MKFINLLLVIVISNVVANDISEFSNMLMDDGTVLITEDQTSRPDIYDAFEKARLTCADSNDWNYYSTSEECPGAHVYTCDVPMTLEEGEGILRIHKFGPFTTTGGMEKAVCTSRAIVGGTAGQYITRTYTLLSDPHSGDPMGYPPVHFHHGYLSTNLAYKPKIPKTIEDQLPFLVDSFNCGTSSCECPEQLGGMACYSRKIPLGTALKQYKDIEVGGVRIYFEDVRSNNAPPLSMQGEFGQFLLTKPSVPITTNVAVAHFAVGGKEPPYVYTVPYGKDSYITGTYWIPVRMRLFNTNIHTHGSAGDETWIIRGSETDLGVPPEERSFIYWSDNVGIEKATNGWKARREVLSDPVTVPEGKTLDDIKRSFEKAMEAAGKKWEIDNNCPGCDSVAPHTNQTKYFIHYDPKNPVKRTTKPKIFCKYYSLVDVIDHDDIIKKEKNFHEVMETGRHKPIPKTKIVKDYFSTANDHRMLSNNSSRILQSKELIPGTIVNGEIYKGPETTFETADDGFRIYHRSSNIPKQILNNKDEQYNNLYQDVLPGNYYRYPVSAFQRGEKEYSQCNEMYVHAGDFLTIAAFNPARFNPTHEESTYYDAPVVGQHSRFAAVAEMMDAPWYK